MFYRVIQHILCGENNSFVIIHHYIDTLRMGIYIKENIICAKIDTYTPTIYTMNICILLCIV